MSSLKKEINKFGKSAQETVTDVDKTVKRTVGTDGMARDIDNFFADAAPSLGRGMGELARKGREAVAQRERQREEERERLARLRTREGKLRARMQEREQTVRRLGGGSE